MRGTTLWIALRKLWDPHRHLVWAPINVVGSGISSFGNGSRNRMLSGFSQIIPTSGSGPISCVLVEQKLVPANTTGSSTLAERLRSPSDPTG